MGEDLGDGAGQVGGSMRHRQHRRGVLKAESIDPASVRRNGLLVDIDGVHLAGLAPRAAMSIVSMPGLQPWPETATPSVMPDLGRRPTRNGWMKSSRRKEVVMSLKERGGRAAARMPTP